jgi:hypothetical protein
MKSNAGRTIGSVMNYRRKKPVVFAFQYTAGSLPTDSGIKIKNK